MIGTFFKFIGQVATVGLVILLIPVGMSLAAFVGWPFELASHFVFFYSLGAAVLAVCFLMAGMWIRFAVAFVVLVFCGIQMYPLVYPAAPLPGESAMLRVGMANLNMDNRDTEKVTAWVAEEDPDILVFFEVTEHWVKELDPVLEGYPHRKVEPREGPFGMIVASRIPLENVEVLRDPKEGLKIPMILAEVDVLGTRLHLAAAHPMPPAGESNMEQRNDYLFELADRIFHLGDEAILVAGDLNCTPWSPDFEKFLSLSNLEDSSRGRGLKWTWRPSRALPKEVGLPIDHFLISNQVEVVDRRIGGDIGSDHYPMTIDLNLGEGRKG